MIHNHVEPSEFLDHTCAQAMISGRTQNFFAENFLQLTALIMSWGDSDTIEYLLKNWFQKKKLISRM